MSLVPYFDDEWPSADPFPSVLLKMLSAGQGVQVSRIVVKRIPIPMVNQLPLRQRTIRHLPVDDSPQSPSIRLCDFDPGAGCTAMRTLPHGSDRTPVTRTHARLELRAGGTALAFLRWAQPHVCLRATRDGAVVDIAHLGWLARESPLADGATQFNGSVLGLLRRCQRQRPTCLAWLRAEAGRLPHPACPLISRPAGLADSDVRRHPLRDRGTRAGAEATSARGRNIKGCGARFADEFHGQSISRAVFAGSGTTAEACVIEGRRCVLIERDERYAELVKVRLAKPIQPGMFDVEAS